MNIYYLIYYNSLRSAFLLSLYSENAWFAALQFGGYNMWLATLAAFVGSTLGMSVTFGLGFYMSRWRENLPLYNANTYERFAGIFRKYLFLLMAVPQLFILELLPGMSLFVLTCGLLRVPPLKAVSAIAFGRAAYYAYYIYQYHQTL